MGERDVADGAWIVPRSARRMASVRRMSERDVFDGAWIVPWGARRMASVRNG